MNGDTEREALTEVIRTVTDLWDEPLDDVHDVPPIVNAILAEFMPARDKRMRAEVGERAWREGYYAGKRDYAGSITGGMPVRSSNPYRGES